MLQRLYVSAGCKLVDPLISKGPPIKGVVMIHYNFALLVGVVSDRSVWVVRYHGH